MNPTITLSATEAQDLHTNGTLVKTVESEWQPHDREILDRIKPDGSTFYYYEEFNGEDYDEWGLTPPFKEGVVYDALNEGLVCTCTHEEYDPWCDYHSQNARVTITCKPELNGSLVWKCTLESVK